MSQVRKPMDGLRNDRTILVRHKTDASEADPVTTPIFQTSAFRAGDPYFYTRNANPNFCEVEEILADVDRGESATLYSSGMAAIAAVLHLLRPGNSLVVNRLIYGCSYRFISDYCQQFNIWLRLADLSNPDETVKSIDENTSMVLFETPTNPFLRTIDIQAVADRLHSSNPAGLVVVDNTWATPIFQKPLTRGADVTVYSGSKFFSGHSDVIIGAAVARTASVGALLRKYRFYSGAVPDPFSAWLIRRSLQTLEVRLERHVINTSVVAQFLRSHAAVTRVYLPEIDGNQLSRYGGLLFAQMGFAHHTQVDVFLQSLELFDHGTSMATVASAAANPYFGSHLSMSSDEKRALGLDEFLVRLSIGMEDPKDLIADLSRALDKATNAGAAVAYSSVPVVTEVA